MGQPGMLAHKIHAQMHVIGILYTARSSRYMRSCESRQQPNMTANHSKYSRTATSKMNVQLTQLK